MALRKKYKKGQIVTVDRTLYRIVIPGSGVSCSECPFINKMEECNSLEWKCLRPIKAHESN